MASAELERVRALASADAVLEYLLRQAVEAAFVAGVDRTSIADAVGVSRATLYRRFGPGAARDLVAGS